MALNKDTGKVVWNKKMEEYKDGYSNTAAPLIVKGKVIAGNSGGEFGITVRSRRTMPRPARRSGTARPSKATWAAERQAVTMTGTINASWPGDMWKTGGGAAWLGGTYDPELNLLFFGTGNPAPWNSWLRPGDNKWTASTLAIDPDSGEIKWHFQTTPHDGWDFDGVNEFIPFELKKDGQTVKAGAKADRNGFFFVLDRTTGKFISASPSSRRSPGPPGSTRTAGRIRRQQPPEGPRRRQGLGQGQDPVFAAPSFLGGKNWMPMAYSQKTGLFYVPSNEWGMDIWNEPINYKKGAAFLGAGFSIKPIYDDHIGVLRAIDPATGKIKFEVNNRAPLWGGVLATGGGLVFYGTPEGYLQAVDDHDRRGGVEVQYRLGRRRLADHLGAGRRAVRRRRLRLGRRGPALGRCGGRIVKNFNQGGMLWVFKLAKASRPST